MRSPTRLDHALSSGQDWTRQRDRAALDGRLAGRRGVGAGPVGDEVGEERQRVRQRPGAGRSPGRSRRSRASGIEPAWTSTVKPFGKTTVTDPARGRVAAEPPDRERRQRHRRCAGRASRRRPGRAGRSAAGTWRSCRCTAAGPGRAAGACSPWSSSRPRPTASPSRPTTARTPWSRAGPRGTPCRSSSAWSSVSARWFASASVERHADAVLGGLHVVAGVRDDRQVRRGGADLAGRDGRAEQPDGGHDRQRDGDEPAGQRRPVDGGRRAIGPRLGRVRAEQLGEATPRTGRGTPRCGSSGRPGPGSRPPSHSQPADLVEQPVRHPEDPGEGEAERVGGRLGDRQLDGEHGPLVLADARTWRTETRRSSAGASGTTCGTCRRSAARSAPSR